MTDFWQCKFCGAQNDKEVCWQCDRKKGELVASLPDSKMVVGVK